VGAAKWIRHADKRLNINEEAVSLTSPLSAALSRPADRFSHNSAVSPITDHLSMLNKMVVTHSGHSYQLN